MKTLGLTLGKFAPLHKGHQSMIETALQEVDELIVVIYETTVITIPLHIRANWIRKLYPTVRVIEAWDGPDGYSDDREHEIREEQYILGLLEGEQVTHFYSSEFYGEHMSVALGAVDRRVDEARVRVPISATMIRSNPYKYREFVSDIVYRDLITKVVFVGAMSTGKSTITEALARRYHTSFASEYGRDYWTEHQVDRRIGLEAFDEIAVGHIEREEKALLGADRYLFVDTNAITTYMYALDYHGRAPELLTRIALENAQLYDLFFLCDDDIPYDDTWDRSGDQKRQVFHRQIIADLQARRIPFITLRGSLEERMHKVDEVLAKFEPYRNYFGELNG
ncbi:AAA family ATPase [Paenibacillus segetis]|uniref:Trifunctional nicotinamide-nucleotide adenylyltransferase/ribosylnicotinamide kinase/transcriptional regulator NadR n=1 Tax=Paenibacillus segetis TaxID=1325360 RepID=A0ABQ1YLK3_9BACL|nr:AAA family ATPase [Paenibacillus segetis]GGH30421.1 trifunctional nicotinamide-nucleotide adenylyltransferase/ribosylnicotinamide kinase/transcriptional regulator NadR [Paenibacillus segetis]